jgi:hypothetical protein
LVTLLLAAVPAPALDDTSSLAPLDAQNSSWADDTWSDYKPLPGRAATGAEKVGTPSNPYN